MWISWFRQLLDRVIGLSQMHSFTLLVVSFFGLFGGQGALMYVLGTSPLFREYPLRDMARDYFAHFGAFGTLQLAPPGQLKSDDIAFLDNDHTQVSSSLLFRGAINGSFFLHNDLFSVHFMALQEMYVSGGLFLSFFLRFCTSLETGHCWHLLGFVVFSLPSPRERKKGVLCWGFSSYCWMKLSFALTCTVWFLEATRCYCILFARLKINSFMNSKVK